MMRAPRKPPSDQAARKRAADTLARAKKATGDCLGRATRSLARKVTQVYDRHLAPHDVSLPQFGLMSHIAAVPDNTFGALATDLGLDPSTLTRNLQSLEKLGLVEIAVAEDDLRKRSVWLTEAGALRLAAAVPAWEAAQREIDQTLGPGFRAAVSRANTAL